MTQDEKIKSILKNDIIYKKMINKSKIDYRIKEDILQQFYLKMCEANTLPNTELELLKYSKVALKFLIWDFNSPDTKTYKDLRFGVDRGDTYSIDEEDWYFEDDSMEKPIMCTREIRVKTELNAKQLSECITYEDHQEFFISVLDDCLKESFLGLPEFERIILVRHLHMGYTAKELGAEYNILIQSVKNIVLKFREFCNIQVNIRSID